MTSDEDTTRWMAAAENSFARARRRAFIESIVGQLGGRPTDLLPFDVVKEKLDLVSSSERGLREIPVDSIVGSVGRYREFTRSFLPRDVHSRERWKRIYAATQGMKGLPPVEVYQVGDVYFVKDGNHRVSVAREMGAETIQAYVREFVSPVPLSKETNLDDLIIKAEATHFSQHTRLDNLRPAAQIEVTSPGYYEKLEEHIAVHGYFLGLDEQRETKWGEAVTHWFDHVYSPMVNVIREHDILQDFPGRTETDLYLWIMEHRHFLAEELGQEIDLAAAANDFAQKHSPRLGRAVGRMQNTMTDRLMPEPLERGSRSGHWRRERVQPRGTAQLFADILVPLAGSASHWCAIEQALAVARRERGLVYGLCVTPSEAAQEPAAQLGEEFSRRCEAASASCKLITEVGDVKKAIAERARWVDLVVLNRPEGVDRPVGLLSESQLHGVIRRAWSPVLAVGESCSPLRKALVAYDASPTSEEALFVAAHMARNWGIALTVVTVEEAHRTSPEVLDRAMAHLSDHGIAAEAVFEQGSVASSILLTAESHSSDLLIMGGTGHSPFVDIFVRTTVEHVLRHAACPVLICR